MIDWAKSEDMIFESGLNNQRPQRLLPLAGMDGWMDWD
jgi:hypothetical protein